MTNFIETQKELAREEMRGMYYDDSDEFPHLLDTLITQVIQNTLEEVGKRTEPDNTVSLIAQAIRERDTYWKEKVEEIIKMADALEVECGKDGDKGTKQWMAFKGFRNTIRDRFLTNEDNLK